MILGGTRERRLVSDVLDYGFISCLVFAAVLGGDIVPFLIVFGLLPAILFSFGKNRPRPLIPFWAIFAPVGLYLTYSTAAMFIYPGIEPGTPRPVNPDLELYVVAAIFFILGLIRSLQIKKLSEKTVFLLPWALFALFVILSALFFSGFHDGCRVRGAASWPFIPALVFSTLSILSLLTWPTMSTWQRRARLALLSMSIVVVVGYTASRGVAVGLATVIVLLCLASLYRPFRHRVPSFRNVVVASLIGTIACFAIDSITGCGVLDRFKTIWQPIYSMIEHVSPMPNSMPNTAASVSDRVVDAGSEAENVSGTDMPVLENIPDASINLRLQMWIFSAKAIQQEPLLGHGALSLQMIIGDRFGFEHPHNQFLSWMITGGLLTFSVGLVFLMGSMFISWYLPSSERVFLFAAVPLLWGVSMMFDAFLSLDFYLHYFCFLSAFLFALCSEMAENRKDTASVNHA